MNAANKAAKVKRSMFFGECKSVVIVFFFSFDIAASESIRCEFPVFSS